MGYDLEETETNEEIAAWIKKAEDWAKERDELGDRIDELETELSQAEDDCNAKEAELESYQEVNSAKIQLAETLIDRLGLSDRDVDVAINHADPLTLLLSFAKRAA